MVITAKFASSCPKCGLPISAGAKVEWSKGAKATHVACPVSAKPVPLRKVATRAPRARRDPVAGEQTISRRSSGRGDSYDVGATVYLPRVRGGSGDGHWHTIVSTWSDAPCEDMGHYDWMCSALVRPATDAERMTAQTARSASQRRAALAAIPAWVVSQVRQSEHCTDESVPAGAWRYSVGARMAGSETLYVTVDAVWYVESSYDDGPRVWRMPVAAEAVAMLGAAIEVLS